MNTNNMLLNAQYSYALGAIGEYCAKSFLESYGYQVTPAPEKSGDLLATRQGRTYKIEVKTARKSAQGRWNFQLFKCDKYGSTNHLNSDFILLLAVTPATIYYYIIPSSKLRTRSKIAITSHPTAYTGHIAQYRHNSNRLDLAGV